MSETLNIFGSQFTGVTGIKATNSSNQTLTYIIPQGSISINNNGNSIDVTNYATANVSVGSVLPTQHTVNLEFSDETDTDISIYYSDSLIGTMITNYAPNPLSYNNKIVYYASLDNTQWLDNSATWETLWDGNVPFYQENNGDYPYCWISSLGSTPVVVGDVYKVTYNNTEYICTAKIVEDQYTSEYTVFGNTKYFNGTDDGSGVPFIIIDYTIYGAWSGQLDVPNETASYYIKIEHQVTA